MAASLVEHSSAGFADGNAGHVIAFTGGPSAGQLDVITVNSNTVVTTPSGFTVARSRINSQGSYIYYRFAAGGESANVTITTSGDHSTVATWSRWSGASTFDLGADNGVDSSAGLTTPTQSTGTLAATNELVVVLAALHNLSSGIVPSAPSWSSGYTPLDTASDVTGTGGDGAHVAAFTGYRTNAGTAAESPNVTWTNVANDRYILAVTFTAAGAATQNAAAAVTATGTVATTAAATRGASVALSGTGTITGTATASRGAAASLAGSAASTAAGAASRAATTALMATATITATASVSPGAAAALVATATITAAASVTRGASAALVATATITTTATAVPPLDTSPDLDITISRPRTAWTVGAPRTAWDVDQPQTAWTIGRPR